MSRGRDRAIPGAFGKQSPSHDEESPPRSVRPHLPVAAVVAGRRCRDNHAEPRAWPHVERRAHLVCVYRTIEHHLVTIEVRVHHLNDAYADLDRADVHVGQNLINPHRLD